ncbi:MAG: hypothetical protein ABJC09_09195 [Terriglobia bacterium]
MSENQTKDGQGELGRLLIQPSENEADIQTWRGRVGAPGWVLLQSYTRVSFRELDSSGALPPDLPPLGEEFAGSIFGPKAEIRWTRGNGSVSVLLFEDANSFDGPESGGKPVSVLPRDYFGLGYWSKQKGFWEPKLPEASVAYPPAPAVADDRPRFRVHEYRSLENLEMFEALVNKPALIAWRLVSFSAGRS